MLLVAVSLGGCGGPRDLALSAVTVVNNRMQKEIPPPSAALVGLVGVRNLPQLGLPMDDPKPDRAMLRIEFASDANIPRYAFQNGYTLFSTAFFCDDPRLEEARLGSPDVYSKGKLLNPYDTSPINDDDKPPFLYYRYIPVAGIVIRNRDENGKEFYDLRKSPRDICLIVRGGKYFGRFETNTMTISKESIAEALGGN